MFSSSFIYNSIFTISVLMITGFIGNKLSQNFEPKNDEYELIKKYLLNDTTMDGYNKPKIWIHSKYEVNSRKWKDFYSRNTTDLNQPYIHLTIKTIINHCGDDFHICLIDDDTFSKLIPSWTVDLKTMAEPMKTQMRNIGILELIYYYGGVSLPNSFLCLRNISQLYANSVDIKKPFICEQINRNVNIQKHKKQPVFMPDMFFIGAAKNDPLILEYIEFLKAENASQYFTKEREFLGNSSEWCLNAVRSNKMVLIDGEYVGVKTVKRKPILLEELMEEAFLELNTNAYGIYIPQEDILIRTKYQWFAIMPIDELLKTNMVITKYLAASIVDSSDTYKPNKTKKVGQSMI